MRPFSMPWQARAWPARLLCGAIILLFAIITPIILYYMHPIYLVNDYFAFRSFSRFIRVYPAASIYDYSLLQSFQKSWPVTFPYLYQPQMLLLVGPLAYLPYELGYALWMLPGLALCVIVLWTVERNPLAVAAVLFGPATLLVSINGQSSMLAAGLMFGGFALLPRRPVLAGVLFGLMIYKPQLGLLVPVALLASRQWLAIASACATAVLVILLSAAVFGLGVWSSWWHHLPAIGAAVTAKTLELSWIMATVTGNLLASGATPSQAHAVQVLSTLTMAILVWRCFRVRVCMLGAALVAAATFLATPFAFGYDLAVFNLSVIVTASERWRRHGRFTFLEVVALVLGFLLPWCGFSPAIFRFSSLVVLGVVCVILHRLHARDRDAVVRQGPVAAAATA